MSQTPPANGSTTHKPDESAARQCVKYSFFKVDSSFRRLPREEHSALKLELIQTIRHFNLNMLLRAYSLFGLRGDVDFMLWQVAEYIDDFIALAAANFITNISGYLH